MNLKTEILAAITEAHRLDAEFAKTHFNLGSAFTHCRRIEEFLPRVGRIAVEAGLLSIYMPSEYYNPTWQVKDGVDLENIGEEAWSSATVKLDAKLAKEQAMEDARRKEVEAWEAARIAEGKTVRVVAGRKVKVGTIGTVVGILENAYEKHNERVNINVGGQVLSTYKHNLEVVPS